MKDNFAQVDVSGNRGIPTRASLNWPMAIINSFFGVSADFYPRIVEEGRIKSLSSAELMGEMGPNSNWVTLDAAGMSDALGLARQSLNEVKSQTEYQDQKATRLLTVTTFLTAFSGVLFTRFEDSYEFSQIGKLPTFQQWLVWGSYCAFGLFILAALSGALVIFHATRTRFKYSSTHSAERQEKDPASLEFYSALIAVRPTAWMNAWVSEKDIPQTGSDTPKKVLAIRSDLQARYLHNLVSETYLVAAKAADKLRYLQPGQSLLAISLRCLFVWLIIIAVTTMTVPSVRRAAEPTAVRLMDPINIAVSPSVLPVRDNSAVDHTKNSGPVKPVTAMPSPH